MTLKTTGFTMIEVVIAFALTAMMIVSVYAATNAATAVANRQKASAAEFNQTQRFLEVLQRDLRGWTMPQADAANAQNGSAKPEIDEQSLLKFSTTADPFAASVTDGSRQLQPRASGNLQYIIRPILNEFEILRVESSSEKQASTLSVLRQPQMPKIEFFDGKQWSPQWQKKDRPAAVRIQIQGLISCISL